VRFWLLARLCFAGRDWLPAGFQSKVSHLR
jgi:hypothetical protein